VDDSHKTPATDKIHEKESKTLEPVEALLLVVLIILAVIIGNHQLAHNLNFQPILQHTKWLHNNNM